MESMFLRHAFLFITGISAGGIVAAGIFAFLAVIGIFPRLIDFTGERSHILLCETMMILGGAWGCVIDLYEIPLLTGGSIFLAVMGSAIGIFVGALVMSLSETLKAFPVFSRRVKFGTGLQYTITSMAVGKCIGSLIYFIYGFAD